MKRLYSLKTPFALTLLLFVAFACKEMGSKGEPVTLKSADGKFQITAPAGWKLASSSGVTNEVINAENPQLDLGVIVTAKPKADLADMTLDKYTDAGRSGQASESANKDVSDPESITINGYEARQYEVKRDKATCLVTAIESPEHFHRITACGANTKYPDNKPSLKEIIGSFRAL